MVKSWLVICGSVKSWRARSAGSQASEAFLPPSSPRKFGLRFAWLPKPKGFTTEAYFRAALEKSKTENCPLALRQGGGNDIGLVGGDPLKFNPGRRQSWDMYGVPTFWEHRDVHQFLSQEGWKSLEVRNRAKRRGQHVWVFHASPPPFQDKTVDSTWSYANHDNSCHITILRESPKPRKDASSTAVPAPRKKWVAPEFVAHVDDFDSETAINQSESKDDSGKARDRSHRRKPPGGKGKTPDSEASAVDPDLLLLKRAPGWSIKDEGGTGDCGFRSAARCLATWQKKVWDKEETVVSEASRLRTMAVGHLVKHSTHFKPFWSVDSQELPVHRDNQPAAQDYEEFCMLASRKNYWCEGFLLQALARRLQTHIISFVWDSQDQNWHRFLIPPHEDHVSSGCAHPICLVLKGGHYRALIPSDPKQDIPKGWFQATAAFPRGALRAGAKSSSLSVPASSPCHSQQQQLRPGSNHAHSPGLSLGPSSGCSGRERKPNVNGATAECTGGEPGSALDLPPETPVKQTSIKSFFQPQHTMPPSIQGSADLNIPSSSSIGHNRKRKRPTDGTQTERERAPDSHLTIPDSTVPAARSLNLVQAFSSVAGSAPASHNPDPPQDRHDGSQHARPRSWHRTQIGQLWWSCDICDFKVYWVPGVSSHSDARRRHLIEKHEFAPTAIPKLKAPKLDESVSARYYKQRWAALLEICAERAWPGMHSLTKAKLSWKCSKCDSGRILSSQVAAQVCPAYEGNHKAIPSLAARKKLWQAWYDEARNSVHISKTEAAKRRVALRVQNKAARQAAWDESASAAKRLQPFRGLPLINADRSQLTWWHCPMCDYTVKHGHPRRSDAKAKHLKEVHQSNNILLDKNKNDSLANPARLVRAADALDARWKRMHELIKNGPWAGAHLLELEPAYYREYVSKAGKPWSRAMYRCRKCSMVVSLSDYVTAVCRLAEKPPPLSERKAIWKTLRKQTVQRTKKPPKSKRRVHPARGVRIGEAQHPGPSRSMAKYKTHDFKVWSVNICSWRANGTALLDSARDEDVTAILLQETNVSDISAPSFSHQLLRAGWHHSHLPPPDRHRKGGVAILTREPCSLVQIAAIQEGFGQFVCAEVIGLQRPFFLGSIYRHASDLQFEIFHHVSSFLEANNGKEWILAMDANASMEAGIVPDTFSRFGGVCSSCARHTTVPIDGIWHSAGLPVLTSQELPSPGDHTIAEISFNLTVAGRNFQHLRFTHTHTHPNSVLM